MCMSICVSLCVGCCDVEARCCVCGSVRDAVAQVIFQLEKKSKGVARHVTFVFLHLIPDQQ